MLAEVMVRVAQQMIRKYPPEGRSYWAARFWDRTPIETAPLVKDDLQVKQEYISNYVSQHGKDAKRLLEFSCGTGDFTKAATALSTATEIVAVDISARALEIAGKRVTDPRLRFVQGDFWADLRLGTADLVMCINAIHHMGNVRDVLKRLTSFVEPGGILIGNVWTMDNYHEFQRCVHGARRHLARSALFLANAVVMRATSGRVRWASYRSQILTSDEIKKILQDLGPEVLELDTSRYFVLFTIRC